MVNGLLQIYDIICGMESVLHLLLLGSLVFMPPKEHSDLALRCRILANAKAEPVEMPRATAYLMNDRDGSRLEDRYDVYDLWRTDAIRGRWVDLEDSRFSVCRIPRKIPGDVADTSRTRSDYAERSAAAVLGPKDLDALDEAVYLLAPVEVMGRFAPRRSQRQKLAALWQYDTTNANAFVFAFRPRVESRTPADWYMVSLVSDDPEAFEKIDQWLDEVEGCAEAASSHAPAMTDRKLSAAERETELLASDYRRSVINYDDWRFTSSSNLVVVDNMAEVDRRPFIAAFTNGLPRMQAAYRTILPSPLIDDIHIAAVRIFATREEYLAYVGTEMKWSAALWSPQHRELVLYCPPNGWETLLRTVWHEALHQHLDYACSMIQTPPWFNEGHAELFAHTHYNMDGEIVFDLDAEAVSMIHPNATVLAEMLPTLLAMDYPEFYDGSREDRRLKYQLSWSLAYFLQVGAPKVRFQPFKSLRADLMRSVVRAKDRNEAMRIVLTDEMRKDLIAEWLSFWKKQ